LIMVPHVPRWVSAAPSSSRTYQLAEMHIVDLPAVARFAAVQKLREV